MNTLESHKITKYCNDLKILEQEVSLVNPVLTCLAAFILSDTHFKGKGQPGRGLREMAGVGSMTERQQLG